MKLKGLSLNTIPPISIPLRFFLTAPLFGILAAAFIFYSGSDIWMNRWNYNSLALTHLLTIGFMLMVMTGALYQFVPVMTGELIPATTRLAPLIHFSLASGTLLLVCGFLGNVTYCFILALALLGLAMITFSISLIPLLLSRLKKQLIVFLMRVLFIVLLVTIGLGLFMLLAYSLPQWQLQFRLYTDVHALWGLLGWVALLIMAVSSQVVPMFFVTPEFSVKYLKSLSLLMLVTLVLLSVSVGVIYHIAEVVFSIELLLFSVYTLVLIKQRKRKVPDMTLYFFYISFASLILAICFWWLSGNIPDSFLQQTQHEFIIAILLIYGFSISSIIGMKQKIVPFLIYINLQNLSINHPGSNVHVPNMKAIISNYQSKLQFYIHTGSLILLLFSVIWNEVVWIAAVLMLANFLWLLVILYRATVLYRFKYRAINSLPVVKFDFNRPGA